MWSSCTMRLSYLIDRSYSAFLRYFFSSIWWFRYSAWFCFLSLTIESRISYSCICFLSSSLAIKWYKSMLFVVCFFCAVKNDEYVEERSETFASPPTSYYWGDHGANDFLFRLPCKDIGDIMFYFKGSLLIVVLGAMFGISTSNFEPLITGMPRFSLCYYFLTKTEGTVFLWFSNASWMLCLVSDIVR